MVQTGSDYEDVMQKPLPFFPPIVRNCTLTPGVIQGEFSRTSSGIVKKLNPQSILLSRSFH